MFTKYIYQAACAAALLSTAQAQQTSKIVPSDLSSAFASSSVDIQVSYTDDAVNGFTDGTTFDTKSVAKAPTFALGDSSSIGTNVVYTIMLLDTTCDNNRALHYLQTNFKFAFDITNIESGTDPLLKYAAPGAFKETGDDRKYSFLMYIQPGNKNVTSLKFDSDGAFDVKKFQDDNGFEDAATGVGMVVKLGGTANCDGQAAQSGGGSSSGAAAATTAASSVAATSGGKGGGGGGAAPTSTAGGSTAVQNSAPVPTAAPSSAVPTGAAESETGAAGPETSAAGSGTGAAGSETGAAESGGSTAAAQSSGLADVSSVLGSNSTAIVTSTAKSAGATGSSTSTGGVAQATGEATELSMGMARCVAIASLIAFAGLLAF